MKIPPLPQLVDDKTGSNAQEILRAWVVDGGNNSQEVAEALTDFLNKGSGGLMLLRGSAGVTPQTRSDIENLRARAQLYEEFVDTAGDDLAARQAWVLGPMVQGDFRNVPNSVDDDLYKMPGIFTSTEDGQTEVARFYQLATAVGYENENFWNDLKTLGKDLGKAIEKKTTPSGGTAIKVGIGVVVGLAIGKLLD